MGDPAHGIFSNAPGLQPDDFNWKWLWMSWPCWFQIQ